MVVCLEDVQGISSAGDGGEVLHQVRGYRDGSVAFEPQELNLPLRAQETIQVA